MLTSRIPAIGMMLGLSVMALPVAATAKATQGACDEACLKGFMDTYLDALAKHDPSLVPTAAHYRYTENGAQIPLGEALWFTFNSYGKYRHDVSDPQTGGIATYLSITENKEMPFPDLLAIRLKVADHKITESETVVTRHARGAENMPPKDPSWMATMDRIEPEALEMLQSYSWPGNVTELRTVLRRLMMQPHSGILDVRHLADMTLCDESCFALLHGMTPASGTAPMIDVPLNRSLQ